MNKLLWALLAIATIVSLWRGFAAPHDPAHDAWWSRIPVFFALYGFVGCIVIIFFAKILGKLFLRKGDEYYDAD